MSNHQPRIIKKYANRKLYDMEERRYVTQTAVQELVNRGVDLTVVDQVTQSDITATVLGRATSHTAGSPAEAVRDQLTSLLRSSLTIPFELGRNARGRLQTSQTTISAEEFAELRERVEDLFSEVEQLKLALRKDVAPMELVKVQ